MGHFLPEGDKHHQFDTEELAHGSDWHQFLLQCSVKQHETIHGKLERGGEHGKKTRLIIFQKHAAHFSLLVKVTLCNSTESEFTSLFRKLTS